MIGNRVLSKHIAKQRFYDSDWKELDFSDGVFPTYDVPIPKPLSLEEMLYCAERLSEDFCYARVDFYEISGKIFFGEITFTPKAGAHKNWKPSETDRNWGDMIVLPNKFILEAKNTR